MNSRTGPPDRGGAPTPESADHHHPHSTTRHHPSGHFYANTQPRRYAEAWRRGFGCGFRDALRLAARELPPETWGALEELADRYELAGGE